MEDNIKIGYTDFEGIALPLEVTLKNNSSWLIVGASGGGKSILTLYITNQLLSIADKLYLADFKNSHDYEDIVPNYAVGTDCSTLFLDFYKEYEDLKNGTKKGRIWFIWDELAGNLIWLESQDKKRAQDIKNKMGEVLMMGRELSGGSAGIISVLQRPDSSHFSAGARENYHVRILMGNSSFEARKMLGFTSEEIPDHYRPGIGKGLMMSNNMPFPTAFTVPKIDKLKLQKLLQKKGNIMNLSNSPKPIGT